MAIGGEITPSKAYFGGAAFATIAGGGPTIKMHPHHARSYWYRVTASDQRFDLPDMRTWYAAGLGLVHIVANTGQPGVDSNLDVFWATGSKSIFPQDSWAFFLTDNTPGSPVWRPVQWS